MAFFIQKLEAKSRIRFLMISSMVSIIGIGCKTKDADLAHGNRLSGQAAMMEGQSGMMGQKSGMMGNGNKSSPNPSSGSSWKAPAYADTVQNPISGNADALTAGSRTFAAQCALCHGQEGKGDGMAGAALTPRPTNLASDFVQSQSDGALYWKITNGNPPMPAMKGALTDSQRWQLVDYIRSLHKTKRLSLESEPASN